MGAGVPEPRSANPQKAHATYSAIPPAISGRPSAPLPNKSGRPPLGKTPYGSNTVQKPGRTIVKISVRRKGDIISKATPAKLIAVEVAQPFGKCHVNAPGGGVNAQTNIFGQGNEQFAGVRFHGKKRGPRNVLAGEMHIAHNA